MSAGEAGVPGVSVIDRANECVPQWNEMPASKAGAPGVSIIDRASVSTGRKISKSEIVENFSKSTT